jgi:hypothetical protein
MTAGLFMEWAVGKVGEIFAADAGKLMLPGAKIRWEIHMFAVGEEIKDDQIEMAIYFYPKGVVPARRTVLRMFDVSRGSELDIPPNQTSITQNFFVLPAPARLENFQPHMHMRGKAMSVEAVYPDGRKEVLSAVNNFQWKWHVNYVYADHAAPLLPKGTTLVFTAWHDNTSANPNNPDPTQWVGWVIVRWTRWRMRGWTLPIWTNPSSTGWSRRGRRRSPKRRPPDRDRQELWFRRHVSA